MEYYVNKRGKVIGRLYECGSGFAAEIGRYSTKAKFCRFFANKSAKFKTYHQAENFLFKNGCVSVGIA